MRCWLAFAGESEVGSDFAGWLMLLKNDEQDFASWFFETMGNLVLEKLRLRCLFICSSCPAKMRMLRVKIRETMGRYCLGFFLIGNIHLVYLLGFSNFGFSSSIGKPVGCKTERNCSGLGSDKSVLNKQFGKVHHPIGNMLATNHESWNDNSMTIPNLRV